MKYVVKTGDTLYEIALRYGISLEELIAANPQIPNPNVIQIGQEINIPIAEMPGDFPAPLPTPCPDLPVEQPPCIPCPGGMMPGMGGMMPGMGGMMPGMGGMMPGMGGMMPGMGGMMPGMGGMMPGMDGMLPGMDGMLPCHPCDYFFVIRPGDKGAHVRCIQERMKHLGYYHGACNGRFGSQTKCAVKNYQRDCGMEETGIIDLLMLAALGLF